MRKLCKKDIKNSIVLTILAFWTLMQMNTLITSGRMMHHLDMINIAQSQIIGKLPKPIGQEASHKRSSSDHGFQWLAYLSVTKPVAKKLLLSQRGRRTRSLLKWILRQKKLHIRIHLHAKKLGLQLACHNDNKILVSHQLICVYL